MESTDNIQCVVNKTLIILVTQMLALLDSKASTDSISLGNGSDKGSGQSNTFLTAGNVLYMCEFGMFSAVKALMKFENKIMINRQVLEQFKIRN